MIVLIYVDTGKQVGDPGHIKLFANQDAAETWFEETTQKALPLSLRFWNDDGPLARRTRLPDDLRRAIKRPWNHRRTGAANPGVFRSRIGTSTGSSGPTRPGASSSPYFAMPVEYLAAG